MPQQTNDDSRFWEKFAYGFFGGLAPTLLKLADELLNHPWNFPGWSVASGYCVAAIIYGLMGGGVAWI
jgi:hypothetical protein